MSVLDDNVRMGIIAGAAAAAGPIGEDHPAWAERVREIAVSLVAMGNAEGSLGKAMDRVAEAEVFIASIVKVEKETSSKRCIVSLKTRPSQRYPDGVEPIRTDRWDTQAGMKMCKTVNGLVGHRVAVWKAMEAAGADTKVRVLAHVEDLGPDSSVSG